MQVAVFSDIHANLPALEAVLARQRRGRRRRDLVPRRRGRLRRRARRLRRAGPRALRGLPGRQPRPRRARRARHLHLLRGRRRRGRVDRGEHARSRDLDFLAGLAARPTPRARSRLYHASPRDPIWEYVLWPDQAADCLGAQEQRVSFDRPLPRRALLHRRPDGRRGEAGARLARRAPGPASRSTRAAG